MEHLTKGNLRHPHAQVCHGIWRLSSTINSENGFVRNLPFRDWHSHFKNCYVQPHCRPNAMLSAGQMQPRSDHIATSGPSEAAFTPRAPWSVCAPPQPYSKNWTIKKQKLVTSRNSTPPLVSLSSFSYQFSLSEFICSGV